jgi:predicted Zn-ribbon and HTH transcriptional regulator
MPPAAPSGAAAAERSCELADVFRQYGATYQQAHALSRAQRQSLRDITRCRTAELGGQRQWCERCGYERFVYHSCRNRHCPKCQTRKSSEWVAARRQELLPVPYFHNVFTLPHELNPLIGWCERNQRALLKLLFDAAAETLREFGRRELGGTIGFTLVLHTWDQQLRPHFHVHALIASGALSTDGSRWIAGGARFLFPVHGLSKMFRGKYLAGLQTLLSEGRLDLPPHLAHLRAAVHRRRFRQALGSKPWVVYSQRPFAGPQTLVDYLGRYTHRAALSNHRLLSCRDGQVRFLYRDRRDGDRRKIATLPAGEFIGRFLKHVLPARFQRIRHYGLLANRGKQQRLDRCRELLGASPRKTTPPPPGLADWLQDVLRIDPTRCPCCGEVLQQEVLAPQPPPRRSSPSPDAWDTS